MTADGKYSLPNRDNLTQPIPTRLSQKQKAFFQFFLVFPESTFNFKNLQKKDALDSWNISYITHSEKRG